MKARNLLKSTSIVSGMTMISRVLGLVRDLVIAYSFGAVAGMDAFIIAFKIPNFMRRLFAEGAFSQAFVPVLSEYQQQRSEAETREFIDRIAGTLLVVLLMVTLVALVITPLLIMAFAPGFVKHTSQFHLATGLLRITFPYLMLISLTAFSSAILNCHGRFAVPSLTPALLNIVMISAALWLAPHLHLPIEALAWGVFVAGLLQLAFQLPFLQRIHRLPRPKLVWRDAGVWRVLRLMVPALVGVSVVQLGVLVDTLFASFLRSGSITWLYFSDRLTYFPLGVFGVALATVILPHLSRKHADRSQEDFVKALDWGIRCTLLIGVPAAIGIFVLSGPLLTTLFYHGHFHVRDVLMTQRSLMAFSFGIPAFMLIKVLAAGFYAKQDIKTPVRIAMIALGINVLLNCVLVWPLAHAGLALATSISSVSNVVCLCYYLRTREGFRVQPGWWRFLLRLVVANVSMWVCLWYMKAPLTVWLSWHTSMRALHLGTTVGAATLVYTISLWLMGLRVRDFCVVS